MPNFAFFYTFFHFLPSWVQECRFFFGDASTFSYGIRFVFGSLCTIFIVICLFFGLFRLFLDPIILLLSKFSLKQIIVFPFKVSEQRIILFIHVVIILFNFNFFFRNITIALLIIWENLRVAIIISTKFTSITLFSV